MLEKPSGARREPRWLEAYQGALLLEAARTFPPDPSRKDALSAETAHALVAAFLLTGGRSAEVLGLEVEDVAFDRELIIFRPNTWRRLKTLQSARPVPLHPQLAEILRAYLNRQVLDRPPTHSPAFPFVHHRRGSDAQGMAGNPRSSRCPGRMEERLDPVEDVPAYLLRCAAPDAGWRSANLSFHCESGTRSRLRRHGRADLLPPRRHSAPLGVGGVPH